MTLGDHWEGDNLPVGWEMSTLGECVAVLDNLRVPVNSDEREQRKGDIPYYGATGQVGWIDDYLFDEQLVLVGEDGAPFFDKSKPIAYIIDGKTWVNNHAHVLRAIPGLTLNWFVKHRLDAFDFHDYVNGTTRLKLTQAAMRGIPFPVPPFQEQQRIVAKVEALLARVNAARQRLAKVPAILKRFRQTVLAAACSGRLTADWRSESKNSDSAKCLLERLLLEPEPTKGKRARRPIGGENGNLDEVPYDVPDNWIWKQFGQVVVNHDAGRVPVKQEDRAERQGPYPYYGAFGIIDNIDKFLFDGDFLLVAEDGKNLESRLRPIALRACGQFWVNNHAHVLQPRAGMPLGYLEAYLNSPVLHLAPFLTGIDQVKLNREAMDRIPVPLPPVSEQHEIVRRVEALFRLADAIEKRVAAATARAEKLTQAILAKAFRGELVPTEAELARREGRDYEPASVLLERIRAERTAESKPKQRRSAR